MCFIVLVRLLQVLEPNAMCLSTVDKNGRPSGRFVLLKVHTLPCAAWRARDALTYGDVTLRVA